MNEHQVERPRILLVSPTVDITGPTNSLTLLWEGLRTDFEISFLVPHQGPFPAVLQARGAECHIAGPFSVKAIPHLSRVVTKVKPHLVYLNETNRATRNLALASTLSQVPFICHVRSMGWRHGWLRMGHLGRAAAVIAVSNASAASVARFARAPRLHVVHNGVAVNGPVSPDEASRAALDRIIGSDEHEHVVVCVGNLSPRKDQLGALDIFESVLATQPRSHLCLFGALDRDPDYTRRVIERSRSRAIASRVSVVGWRSDVRSLLSGANVLLHTARLDPHPRAVLEAMAVGLPVVAYDVDGVSETVIDGTTGFLVPPDDQEKAAFHLAKLLSNSSSARAMGGAGRQHVIENFGEAKATQRVAGVISAAVGPSPPRLPTSSGVGC